MPRLYPPEQKAAALQRLQANGGDTLAAHFETGIPQRTLYNWQNAAARLVAEDLRAGERRWEAEGETGAAAPEQYRWRGGRLCRRAPPPAPPPEWALPPPDHPQARGPYPAASRRRARLRCGQSHPPRLAAKLRP